MGAVDILKLSRIVAVRMASLRIILGLTAAVTVIWELKFVSAKVIDDGEREFHTITACSYLENDGTQYNSYSINGRYCCMCYKGSKFAGHCDATSPKSTRCELCPFDENDPNNRTYIDFEPHLQNHCEKTRNRSCSDPMTYYEGSRTEADRCVCRIGMLKDKGNCITIPPIVSPTPDKKTENKTQTGPSATPQETTERSTTSDIPTISSKDLSHSIVSKVTTQISKGTEPQQDPSSSGPGGTSSVSQNAVGTGAQNLGLIIGSVFGSLFGVGLIAAVAITTICLCKRKQSPDYRSGKHRKCDKLMGPIHPDNNVDAEAEPKNDAHREGVRSLLANGREGSLPRQIDGSNGAYIDSIEAINSNASDGDLKGQQPIKNLVQQRDNSDNVAGTAGKETLRAEASFLDGKAEPITNHSYTRTWDSPSNRSPSANTYSGQVVPDFSSEPIREASSRDDSRHVFVETPMSDSYHNTSSSFSQGGNAADTPEANRPHVISIEEANARIETYEAKIIAKEFARRFGYEGNRRYVLPLMRDIVENQDTTIPDDNTTFDDLDNEYKSNTPEFCVKCMRHAIAVKGNGLTAKYLLTKVEKLRMKTYENIVIEEINKILDTRPPPERFAMELR